MWKRLCSILLLLASFTASAQEINCKVTVMYEKLISTGVDPQVFTSMEKAITDFVNMRRWTTDEYSSAERIDCNILINVTSNKIDGDPNIYSGTFSIKAVRPVYNSGYNTSIVNFVDRDFTFRYSQNIPLNFNDNNVNGSDMYSSNFTAVIAYYIYLVIGMDQDSFSPLGGSTIFKKAQNIVNNAPGGGGANSAISGWKPAENNRNRYWLVDQLLNQRFRDVRNFWYTMHREGLDSMTMKPDNARTRILTGIKKLYAVNKDNPSSILMQFIFLAKSTEFMSLLEMTPKAERGQYITLLSALDVPNSAKYGALK